MVKLVMVSVEDGTMRGTTECRKGYVCLLYMGKRAIAWYMTYVYIHGNDGVSHYQAGRQAPRNQASEAEQLM